MEKEKWFHHQVTKYKDNGKITCRMEFVKKPLKTVIHTKEHLSMEKNNQIKVFINGTIIVYMINMSEDLRIIKLMGMVNCIKLMVISLQVYLELGLLVTVNIIVLQVECNYKVKTILI